MNSIKTKEELLERYGAIGFDKQHAFAAIIGNQPGRVEIEQGKIYFGADLIFPIQLIGSFSPAAKAWLWAWGNTNPNFSQAVLQQVLHLKKFGKENDMEWLTTAEIPAEQNDVHRIGIIAAGMSEAGGYYISDDKQGLQLFTVSSDVLNIVSVKDHERMLEVFSDFIEQYDVNHQVAFIHYLTAKGYDVSIEQSTVIGIKGDDRISAAFDNVFRLVHIEA